VSDAFKATLQGLVESRHRVESDTAATAQRRASDEQQRRLARQQIQRLFEDRLSDLTTPFVQQMQELPGYFVQSVPGKNAAGGRRYLYQLNSKSEGTPATSLVFSLDEKGNVRIAGEGALVIRIRFGGNDHAFLSVPLGEIGPTHVEAAFTSYVRAILAPPTLMSECHRPVLRTTRDRPNDRRPGGPQSWMAS
jgi:hypothetical protein